MSSYLVSFIRLAILVSIVASLVEPVSTQKRQLSIDVIFDPERKIDFHGNPSWDLVWTDNDHYLLWTRHNDNSKNSLLKVNAKSGSTQTLLTVEEIKLALNELPGVSYEDIQNLIRHSTYLIDASQTAMVFELDNDLFHYDIKTARVSRLTQTTETEEEVSFSPNGQMLAFVRAHNLYVFDLNHRLEYTLTNDGNDSIRNGKLDWVYQEEIYGRGNFRGYWWSPDSKNIAYLQLDDTNVHNFSIIDHIAYHPNIETWNYPKAGDPNPGVRLGLAKSAGGTTTWVDLDQYVQSQPLVVRVDWSPNSQNVIFQIQDREQTWLDLVSADTKSGKIIHLLKETTEAWVNVNGSTNWLADGSFLWLSERSGWKHLYHYRGNGKLIRQITDGPWEVRQLHGFDEETGWIYFSGTERSHIGSDVYRIKLDGSNLSRLSRQEGTHRVLFNSGFTHYIDWWSTLITPPQVRLHSADGTKTRTINRNEMKSIQNYELSTPEFLQVTNRDGFVMEAFMIKPPDFDPTHRYPVYQPIYAGPHTQRVRNSWTGQNYLFWQLLAQRGVIVWVMDNSTASGKGAVSTWPVYKNFGELELRDIEDGISWLTEQSYVDETRIGIEGWSYGGYMVSYALTHSKSFAMGIAGGSVTDWRDYDTIYTERYMLMPKNNKDGYRKSSPRFSAGNLHGALLLMHGTMDENVHMQNTLQFTYELQKAGKSFEMMLYPRSRHRLSSPELEKHRHAKMLEFVLEHLRPESTLPESISFNR